MGIAKGQFGSHRAFKLWILWSGEATTVDCEFSHSQLQVADLTGLSNLFLKRKFQSPFPRLRDHIPPTSLVVSTIWPLIRVFLSLLYLYTDTICSFCIGIKRIWKELFLDLQTGRSVEYSFLWIGKSGFVKGHSLSRRHKQYISISRIRRDDTSCLSQDTMPK